MIKKHHNIENVIKEVMSINKKIDEGKIKRSIKFKVPKDFDFEHARKEFLSPKVVKVTDPVLRL